MRVIQKDIESKIEEWYSPFSAYHGISAYSRDA